MRVYRQKKSSGSGLKKKSVSFEVSKPLSPYLPCPSDGLEFIDRVSLEELVYWKTMRLFEKFDRDPPEDFLKTVISHVEKPLYYLILMKTRGNQTKASSILGCNRNTLRRRMREFYRIPDYKLREFFRQLEPLSEKS